MVNTVAEAEATVAVRPRDFALGRAIGLLEAVTAYMDVVRDQAIVRLRENNVTVLTRDLRATQDRFNVGEVTRTDVAQAQARRAAAVSALDLGEIQPADQPRNLRARHRPSAVQSGGAAAEWARAEVVGGRHRDFGPREPRPWWQRSIASKAPAMPSTAFAASGCHRLSSRPATSSASTRLSGIDFQETTTVTGRLTVPFYSGGEVEARIRQAKHTHVSRLQEIEQARTEVLAQVVAAWSQLIAARAQLESDQASVDANRIALAGVREEERVGQRTLLDVLNAEQELLNSEVNLVTTKRNLVVASYNVLSTIGRLNSQELGVASLVYDPDAHYLEVRRKWFDVNITYSDGRRETLDVAPAPRPGYKLAK